VISDAQSPKPTNKYKKQIKPFYTIINYSRNLRNTNTIYEFQGDFWHGNPEIYNLDKINTKINVSFKELYEKTLEKIKLLQNMGYNVVYIWENNWRKGIKVVKKIQRIWRKSKQI
jgi:G:T-mismatch repair DNA endonuclease (very short patch repair protein)